MPNVYLILNSYCVHYLDRANYGTWNNIDYLPSVFFSRDNIFPSGKFNFLITAHYFVCVPDLEGTIYVGSAQNLAKDIVYGTTHLKYIGIPIHDFPRWVDHFYLV